MIWPDTDTPEFIRPAAEQVGEVSARILSTVGQLSDLGRWDCDVPKRVLERDERCRMPCGVGAEVTPSLAVLLTVHAAADGAWLTSVIDAAI